ncbi:cupredoxin domain-containing protein [Patescibacteria group bacterium]|nr:cupredoxin domain-containing protein [Patescibacteria group bacterium]
MEEQKNNSSIKWLALGIVIVVLVVVWIFNANKKGSVPVTSSNNATSTSTADVAAAATAQSHFSAVDIRAEGGKFVPDKFSVPVGKILMINFTSVDETYDFGFADPKLGFDVIAKKGETQSFGFDTTGKTPGDYVFHCIMKCPAGGTMEGTMTIQ